jgi:hypothetical protein
LWTFKQPFARCRDEKEGQEEMRTTTLIPKHPPSLAEFKTFIEALPNGAWTGLTGISRGVVEAERGHVYIDYDENYGRYFDESLDEPRKAELVARLGHAPRLALHIQASTFDVGSHELADEVCALLRSRWGGEQE